MKRRIVFWLLCRAWLCILAINAPQLYAYWVSTGDSPRVFQDVIDESLYLRIAIDQGNYRPQEAIYREHAERLPITKLLTHWRPDQTYSHFVVGRIATLCGLRVQELNLVLDLASGVVGYIAIFCFFRLLLGNAHITLAELCGVFFLCFPWIASLENWIDVHALWPAFTGTLGPVEHSTLPIQEGVESQLATVWFAVTLVALLRAGGDRLRPNWRIAMLGLASGFGIYVYVLGWVAVGVLVPFLLCAMSLSQPKGAPRTKLTKALFLWLACHLLTAFPGLAQIHAVRSAKHIFIDDRSLYQLAYYAPLEWLALSILGAIALLLSRDRWSNLSRLLLALMLATLLAEICIMNIQPIVGVATVAGFIVLDFTRPLLSSLTVALVFLRYSRNITFAFALKSLVVFAIILAGIRTYSISTMSEEELDRLTPLVSYVKKNIPRDSVIAMLTHHKPFQSNTKEWDWRWQPNGLAALTQTHLLKEALGLEWGALSPEETIARELALGAVYTGKAQLLRGCAEDLILTPKRLFFLQWVTIQLSRRFNCERGKEIIQSMTTCEAFQRFALDYVIWEPEFNLPKPAYLQYAGDSLWTSPSQDFEVIKLDREKAKELLCPTRRAS